jgi:hypothetical protein
MTNITITTVRRGPGNPASYTFLFDNTKSIRQLKYDIHRRSNSTLNTSQILLFFNDVKLDQVSSSLLSYRIINDSTIYIRECTTFSKACFLLTVLDGMSVGIHNRGPTIHAG